MNCKLSKVKVEKVLKPPHTPTAKNNHELFPIVLFVNKANAIPRIKEPPALESKVAKGKDGMTAENIFPKK